MKSQTRQRALFSPGRLHFLRDLKQLPKPGPNALLIFDKRLAPRFSGFIEQFDLRYPVSSGERLKDIVHFPGHVAALHARLARVPTQKIEIYSLGGGSVGDFAGFFASVFRRGVPVIHIPSTWLAAIDSAHGGKTALNIGQAKNQIGSFWLAREVFVCTEVLQAQPDERLQDALGEVIKIALLSGQIWTKRVLQKKFKLGSDDIVKLMPKLIQAKMDIVASDPRDQTGRRTLLNLGHTLGHVIELSYGLGHGKAVGHGLHFALQVSASEGIMSAKRRMQLSEMLMAQGIAPLSKRKKLSIASFQDLLLQDKKRSEDSKVKLILLREPGQPEVRTLPIQRIVEEAVSSGICFSESKRGLDV